MNDDTVMTNMSLTYDTAPNRAAFVPRGLSKKVLGRYYTPEHATRILCSWGIRRSEEKILEPSFGACGFLEAASCRLKVLGSADPRNQLYGCDIDDAAFNNYLEPKLGIGKGDSQFLHRDFLYVQPGQFAVKAFDVVVGNPPYVSYHNMSEQTRKVAKQVAIDDGFELPPKASLWAFFVLHAILFIRPGGRMAWILPSSFLFAEYATVVRDYIVQNFKRSLIVQLQQRLFLSEGTEELTAVLLADGRYPIADKSGEIHLDFANTLDDLEERIRAWEFGHERARPVNGRVSNAFLSDWETNCMHAVSGAGQVLCVGDIAAVRIGIVTGANPFFILSQSIAQTYELPDACLNFILTKFSLAPGAALTSADLVHARYQNRRCLLLDTDHPDLEQRGSELRRYLATMPLAKRRSIGTFKKRALWHRPDDGRIPDAFFPYMYHHGPRFILNEVGITSTNTIHRVYFKPNARPDGISEDTWHKVCAISILSTFSQLSGELQGRCYGAGVLKHEPSEASRIRLVIPKLLDVQKIDTVFQQIDIALRKDQADEARRYADQFVFQALTPLEHKKIIITLERALVAARRRRHRA